MIRNSRVSRSCRSSGGAAARWMLEASKKMKMTIKIVSYIARGLPVGQSGADKSCRLMVNKLLESCDILCVQETLQDLEKLNSLHKDFHGAGESTTDMSSRIVRGRIPGGVAVFWHKNMINWLMLSD